MHRDPILPQLEPVTLEKSSLSCVCSVWVMPKSDIQVPIVSFEGELGSKASISEDIWMMRSRVEELLGVVEAGHGLVIDIRQVNLETSVELDIVPAKIRTRQEPVRIVVRPETFDFVQNGYPQGEVSTDYASVFPDIAFELKSYRFDKGRQMLERPSLSSLKLIPVSLNISSICFESYTWCSESDSTTSGYLVFRGNYRLGSAGAFDALFIHWRLNQFCEAIKPSRLIVDFRELDYHWGDDFNPYPFRFLSPESPIRFLLTPQQVSSYQSTIYSSNICWDEATAVRELNQMPGVSEEQETLIENAENHLEDKS